MSPKHHEEQRKDIAKNLTAHSPQNVEREHGHIDERNIACGHKYQNAMNEISQHPGHGSDKVLPKLPSDQPTQPP
jgi:hypothetical protein